MASSATLSYEDDPDESQRDGDPRDAIILENQRRIQELQREFRASVRELKAQFADYVRQSGQMQQEMLHRIMDLKEQLRGIDFVHNVCGSPLKPAKRGALKSARGGRRRPSARGPGGADG
jgi:hypothetical protein